MTFWSLEETGGSKEATVTGDLRQIAAMQTVILRTTSGVPPVRIETTGGDLEADFDSFALRLDDNTPITFEQLCDVCVAYWIKWDGDSNASASSATQFGNPKSCTPE